MKSGRGLNSEDSDMDNTSQEHMNEDFAEDVSVFEVSPLGTFMVAVVSQEFLTLKMLPRSTKSDYRKILTASFMLQEHISMSFDDDDNYNN